MAAEITRELHHRWVGGARKHGYSGLWEGPQAAKLIRKLHRQAFEFWAGREG